MTLLLLHMQLRLNVSLMLSCPNAALVASVPVDFGSVRVGQAEGAPACVTPAAATASGSVAASARLGLKSSSAIGVRC